MLKIDSTIQIHNLKELIERFWSLSGEKIVVIEKDYSNSRGAPVFTEAGKYTTRGWTEWTQGFLFGSSILQFDATGETSFLDYGRNNTVKLMAPHVSHTGVHDHGFNNLSTYGNLLRLMNEGKIPANEWEKRFYDLAIKLSGAVQASRWTNTKDGGFIYSFNGPHSLFVDTIRSCRILMASHLLGHQFYGENDANISLIGRAMQHIFSTAKYSVYYGEGRDLFDIRGRVAHESIFNANDGNYRSASTQQGYSGYSTWSRGLAWAMCGFAEQLECISGIPDNILMSESGHSKQQIIDLLLKAAKATCDYYMDNACSDGIPFWDFGAPNLSKLEDYKNNNSNPYNEYEPVDSSAAAIATQGLIRLGLYLMENGDSEGGKYYFQAGLTTLKTLLQDPYLSTNKNHQGILLHSVYHYPNNWDYIPDEAKIPFGESSMWGDYHIREAALLVHKMIKEEPYLTFFSGLQ